MFMKQKISVKHKICYDAAKVTVNIYQLMNTKTTDNDQTSIGELCFAACFAEHNIPLACVDHLLPVCKAVFKDSKLARKLLMKRTKLSYVIQDGLAFDEKCVINNI